MKHLLSIKDLSKNDILSLLSLAEEVKKNKIAFKDALALKSMALIFQKPSARTRVSFEIGMKELGGNVIYLGHEDIKLGKREAVKDISRVMSRYLDVIVARTFRHSDIIELAEYSDIPIINALSDLLHPCQILSDIFTIKEKLGTCDNINLSYIGDGNNIVNSLLYGCSKMGINLSIACPRGYEPDKEIIKEMESVFKENNRQLVVSDNPFDIIENADILYTDVWVSMGQEKEVERRKQVFKNFQINDNLLSKAKKNCIVMHCLPAHRGEEITDKVIESNKSVVFDQAENRIHLQKAVLLKLLK